MNPSLVEITDLVKRKQYAQARTLLQDYLEWHPDDAHAWYLLSFAEASPSERLTAIRLAAGLAPKNRQVKSRLQQLESQRKQSRLPVLVGLLVVLVVVGVGVFILLRPGAPSSASVPTLAVLPSLLPTTDSVVIAEAPRSTPLLANSTMETLLPMETVSTGMKNAVEITALPTAEPTLTQPAPTQIEQQTLPTSSVSQAAPSTVLPLPTAVPSQDNPPPTVVTQPQTPVPTRAPSATATLSGPPPTPITNAAPISSPLDIGVGELRVVAATRPGDALVREVGGSVPLAPAGQKWLLVELLLVCAGSNNCAPEPSSLGVLGTSGTVYAPATTLQIEPLFGRNAYMGGQVWGYTGFTVPDSESLLYLTLTQNNRQYVFALQ